MVAVGGHFGGWHGCGSYWHGCGSYWHAGGYGGNRYGVAGTEDHIGTDGRRSTGGEIILVTTMATRIALMPITIPKLRTLLEHQR